MTNQENNPQKYPCLRIDSNGETTWFDLDANANVLVGSGGHCKIQLSGDDVESLHCILAMEDGQLEARDWSKGRTLVNGQVVSDSVAMNNGDVLKVGDHEITALLSESNAGADAVAEPEVESQDATDETDPTEEPETAGQVEPEATPVQNDQQVSQEEATPAATEFVYDINADFEDETDDIPYGFNAPTFAGEIAAHHELQALRTENEQLRDELSQNSDLLSTEQTGKLVSRLEEVLSELKRSDARSLELEELLRCADQATEEERDERMQMEKWMAQLESRVTQRESHGESEKQRLQKQLEHAIRSQQQSSESLHRLMESKVADGEAIPAEVMEDLRKQVESLQDQLNLAREETDTLREQLAGSPDEADDQVTDSKLAELQFETSRERAEISRQRVELQTLKVELEGRLAAPSGETVDETRLQEMREQLEEFGDEENSKENPEGISNDLADRIAKLLHRVE